MTSIPAKRMPEPSAWPSWLNSATVAWAATTLAFVVLQSAGAVLWFEHRAIEAKEIESTEMYARVVQDQTERTFDTIDFALTSLANKFPDGASGTAGRPVDADLGQALAGLPFLRSLSMMDDSGRVLASSEVGNLDVVVDLARVKLPRPGAIDALGSLLPGRDLVDTRLGAQPGSQARTLWPLARRLGAPAGAGGYLVAVLNPDYFANQHGLSLADDTRSAALLDVEGNLLTATAGIRRPPGERVGGHLFFTRFFPAREIGSFVGAGIDGGKTVTAFRVLRKRPIVVIVERDHASLMVHFWRLLAWVTGGTVAALAAIAALAVTARRSLRGHEAVCAALDLTRVAAVTSERDLRALIESVHELVFRTDGEGRITFVNGRWGGLVGWHEGDLIGRRFPDLFPGADREACQRLFAADRADADSITVQLMNAGGRALTLEVSVSPVPGEGGAPIAHAGFAVDVSARVMARKALESQLKFNAQLLEVSPTPLFVKDAKLRFVTVNRAWLELMGMQLADVLGRNSDEVFIHEGPKHNDQDARLLLSEERVQYENRLQLPGRSPRDTVVTKVRFTRSDGSPAGIVGSIIDVTEFRDAERSIREARDAAALANGAKSEFIANITHELRTPLQAILGFSQLGTEMAQEQADFQEMFADIQAGGQRMLTLVNGLLDVAEMEHAFGALDAKRADVVAVVEGAIGQLQEKATARGQTIELSRDGPELEADVDALRLQQAVRNVLANAVRFGPCDSRIEVRCGLEPEGRRLVVTVRDSGPGIPEAELETVFESFVQSSRTRNGAGGTGLGLTITRMILDAHGGSAVAANAPGGGAVIRLALPAPETASGRLAEPGAQEVNGAACAFEVNACH